MAPVRLYIDLPPLTALYVWATDNVVDPASSIDKPRPTPRAMKD
jgi:hypothetical protein